MKKQSYLTIAAIVAALVLSQVNAAFAQQKRKVLIGFKGPSTSQAANDRANTVRSMGGDVHHSFHVMPVVSAELPEAAIAQLQRRADVTYVEDDKEWHALDQTAPWGISRIRAPIAWSEATGAGVNVAVLDSGIDYDHEDLAGNIAGWVNWAGKKTDGSTDESICRDINGHGTHCAGVIAAMNNGIGVVGVAPQASIWAVKVLGNIGSGSWTDIAQGIEWCIDNGDIRVISMSLGGSHSSKTLENACEAAYAADILIVASAGNTGGDVEYPAAYNSVMAVSAIDSLDRLASYSSRGPEIDLAAPGVGVLSTVPGDGYESWSGTSMACPHVSGVAALLWQLMDGASASSIWTQLAITAQDIGLPPDEQGFGLVNAAAAVGISQVTDLAIWVGVTGPQTMVRGRGYSAGVSVKNVGDTVVPAGVGVIAEDITIPLTLFEGTTTMDLAPGAQELFHFGYYSQYPIGEHTVVGSHNLDDDNPINNIMTRIFQIEEQFMDVAISAVSVPSSVVQGDVVPVEVTVENRGNYWAYDIDVDLSDGETLIGTQTISVLGLGSVGKFEVLSFDWDTSGLSEGEHTLTASHDFIDEDNENNSLAETVEVIEAGSVEYMYASVNFGVAGPHLKINIKVEDSDQAPIEGIEVYVELDDELLPMAVTDSAGQVTYTVKSGASSAHDVIVYDLFDTRVPVAYVADGLPVTGLWP